MSKILDSKIHNELSHSLKINYVVNQHVNSFNLPKFEKNEKGEYVFVGNCSISTLADYNDYLKVYKDIVNHLRKTYRPVIAKIYKNALNSLIADNSKFRIEKNNYSLSTKLESKPFTLDTLEDNTSSIYKQTLNFITKAAFKSKRLKPSSAINDLMRKDGKSIEEDTDKIYILPVMTDNGVVLTQKKQNRAAVEAQFETISYEDAMAIKEYMIDATKLLDSDVASQLKNQIEKIFKEASNIGEAIRAGLDNNLVKRLTTLTGDFADLIGIDLSYYNKNNTSNRKNIDDAMANSVDSFDLSSEEIIPENILDSFEANEIFMNGSYRTTPAIEDGQIVTKLSPEGMKFIVTLQNNKLFVTNKEEDQMLGK